MYSILFKIEKLELIPKNFFISSHIFKIAFYKIKKNNFVYDIN